MGDDRDFDVWERRDIGSGWGPYSSWSRPMLDMIESGYHEFPGSLGVQRDAAFESVTS